MAGASRLLSALTVDLGKDGVWSIRALASPIPRLAALTLLLMALPVTPLIVTAGGAEEDPGLTLSAGETAWAELVAGRPQDAARRAAAALGEDPGDPRSAAVLAMATVGSGQGDPELRVAELLTLTASDDDTTAAARIGLGLIAAEAGDLLAAETAYRSALAAAEAAADVSAQQVAQEQLAVVLIQMSRPPEAIAAAEAALQLARQLERPLATVFAQLTLGRALVRTRDIDRSTAELEAARSAAVPLSLDLWRGDAAIALSVLSLWRVDLDTALELRQEALAAYQRAGDLAKQARAQHYIATIHLRRGHLSQALLDLTGALELARVADDADEQSGCLGELAAISFYLGDLNRALAQYREAERLTAHPYRLGFLRVNIGSILAHRGDHEQALAQFESALEVIRQIGDHRNEAGALAAMGHSLYELDRWDEALSRLDEAIAVARQWELVDYEAYAQYYKSYALTLRGDDAAAAPVAATADSLARRSGFFDIVESVLVLRARIERRQGDEVAALAHLEEALEVVRTVRRHSGGSQAVQSGFFSEVAQTYTETIDLLYHLYLRAAAEDQEAGGPPAAAYAEQAFALAQEAKARSLLDLLGEAEVDLRSRADPRYRAQEAALLEQIATLSAELDATDAADAEKADRLEVEIAEQENRLQALETELRVADPRYAELRYPAPSSLADVQSEVLRPNEALLEYALGDSASYVWLVTSESFVFAQLPPRAEIEERLRELLPLLRDYNLLGPDPTYFVTPARLLHRDLIESVGPLPAGIDRLLMAPDGILHYLPFEALLTRDVTRPSWAESGFTDLPYLIQDRDVVYVPSVSVLQRLRAASSGDSRDTADKVLLVGDPLRAAGLQESIVARAAGVDLTDALPHAAAELEALSEIVGPERCVLLTGAEANSERLRIAGADGPYASIHFAVHGLFNEQRPQYSGLVLSPTTGTDDDGFLTTAEIFGLELDCRQVVLAACSSALGQLVTGEGLVGMTRGFFYAGADRVVAALWAVPGVTTALLMGSFYEGLVVPGYTGDDGAVGDTAGDTAGNAAAALARAKRRLIAGHAPGAPTDVALAHPYFWAAFVMAGNDD